MAIRVIGTAPVPKKRPDTDFVDFVKLLRKLVKEGQSGLIELQFKDGWADVLFFYHEGKIVHFQIISESYRSSRAKA